MWILIMLLVLMGLGVFLHWQNNGLTASEYIVRSAALPESIESLQVVHLSDLHNKAFGSGSKMLFNRVVSLHPDFVVITGDLIDKRRTRENRWEDTILLVRDLAQMVPVYFVSGNHEWQSGLYDTLRPQLEAVGVAVLDNQGVLFTREGESVAILGIADEEALEGERKNKPREARNKQIDQERERILREQLQNLTSQYENYFQILLAHRPSIAAIASEIGVHAACCGHAHGGQVRIPRMGGIFSPDQGFRPAFSEGIHVVENTVVAISRGLGNSAFPFRIFNRPEIVAITFMRELPSEEAEVPQQEVEVPQQEVEAPQQEVEAPQQKVKMPQGETEEVQREPEILQEKAEIL